MHIFSTDTFPIPLPEGHRFPLAKYRLLRETLQREPTCAACTFAIPPAATPAELALAHTDRYVRAVLEGGLTQAEVRELGFPWSTELAERSLRSCGATIAAVRTLGQDRAAVYLGGGTHHAYADRGQGYCVFNDVAVASRIAQRELGVQRIAVIDLDVHQGNGTAAIFRDDDRVFTFSMHGEKNFPRIKEPSDLDLPMPDGCEDSAYLEALHDGLQQCFASNPDLVFYLAGADPWQGDKLGRLNLTKQGLAARDQLVLDTVREHNARLVVTMAGGYAKDVADTVEIQATTVLLTVHHARAGT